MQFGVGGVGCLCIEVQSNYSQELRPRLDKPIRAEGEVRFIDH